MKDEGRQGRRSRENGSPTGGVPTLGKTAVADRCYSAGLRTSVKYWSVKFLSPLDSVD